MDVATSTGGLLRTTGGTGRVVSEGAGELGELNPDQSCLGEGGSDEGNPDEGPLNTAASVESELCECEVEECRLERRGRGPLSGAVSGTEAVSGPRELEPTNVRRLIPSRVSSSKETMV
jgi:hypothetical protein